MKNNLTELVFILDRSGSMADFEADTVGGFNSTIERQKKGEGKVYVSTLLFDNYSKVIHDRVDINEIKPMDLATYQVGGMTALLDAVGGAIRHIGNIHKYARPEDVPEHTVFVINTDGMENASRNYTRAEVRNMIKEKTDKHGWEFIFLAANIDAEGTAEGIGIKRERAVNFAKDSVGMEESYMAICGAISAVRSCSSDSLDSGEWRARLDEDNNRRKNGKK